MLGGGCGGGGDSGPNPSPLMVARASPANGDQQTGPVSQALPNALRIVVTRDGAPQANVAVTWSTTDGSLNPTSGPTDPNGIGASAWTLGPDAGTQTAQAAVQGATGSPVSFSATGTSDAPPPPSTIAVTVGNIFFASGRNGTTDSAVDTVAVNGTVTWIWTSTGATPHSVRSTGTPSFPPSSVLTGNDLTYAFQFTQAGTYTYDCAVHGIGNGPHRGQVIAANATYFAASSSTFASSQPRSRAISSATRRVAGTPRSRVS